ncbi:YicC/YloC family endoribonuclease [Caloramator proteoclasticus]|uniref:TIGR00255 family protein n=1 Tax=Caloramator proteoclasticus DSM 10124 TaxID=1121262 RepID=A0A1M5ANS2_9CLOT|nr:YicC/YloC family endoribonuclease [Caloramator proteoclasticus]SHF31552.1 TIGR00255 family protein [Caloramator proteoclasticus DSM 10124]
MVKSMTGYGRGYSEINNRAFTVELKSVNNRYLDINIRYPKHLMSLEDKIRKFISSYISRGKIDVYISQDRFSKDDIEVKLDENIAKAYCDAFHIMSEKLNLENDITVSRLSKFQDVLSIEKKEEVTEEIWQVLSNALENALNMFIDMRQKEGIKLSEDLITRCDKIAELVNKIDERSDLVVEEYREKIYQRISDFLKDIEVDEARLLNEVAFFADKCNITEEIVRLRSHVKQFKESLNSDEPIGKKLDFLVQEMNRETNTIGSKSNDLTITNIVVEIKSEIEKIREQIQNIE